MGSPSVPRSALPRTLCARHRGTPVGELAAEPSVTAKAVRRGRRVLQEPRFPPEEIVEQFRCKRRRIDPARSQPGLSFAFDEAAALYLAGRLMQPLAGTPLWQAPQRALKRIRASLGTEVPGYIEMRAAMLTNVQAVLESAVLDGPR